MVRSPFHDLETTANEDQEESEEAAGTPAVCKPRLPSNIVIRTRSIFVTTLNLSWADIGNGTGSDKTLGETGILGDHLGLVLTPFGHQGRGTGPEHLWHGALMDERISDRGVQEHRGPGDGYHALVASATQTGAFDALDVSGLFGRDRRVDPGVVSLDIRRGSGRAAGAG